MDSVLQAHLLVVDADPSIRVLLTALLRRLGVRITACGEERDGTKQCLRNGAHYAAIIISSDIPDFESLLDEICLAPPAERPRIVVATTRDMARPIPQADVVLIKPFRLDELNAAMETCGVSVDGRHSRATPSPALIPAH